jgi:hypothetical protein
MAAIGAMETLSEQPQRSASGTTDAIHILQAIFQETHFTTFPDGFVQLSRRAPISPAFTLDNTCYFAQTYWLTNTQNQWFMAVICNTICAGFWPLTQR